MGSAKYFDAPYWTALQRGYPRHGPQTVAQPNQSLARRGSVKTLVAGASRYKNPAAPQKLDSLSPNNHFHPRISHQPLSIVACPPARTRSSLSNHITHFKTAKMPPKAADKKPASKAPATASKAPEKKDAGKKTAASGDKKKRTKARKETYSSYIYKGE
jgi:hypothetical protein